MDREMAESIALEFLTEMNPELWSGEGERPESFNTLIKTFDVDSEMQIDISFEKDSDTGIWGHYCELRDGENAELVGIVWNEGVSSFDEVVDTLINLE